MKEHSPLPCADAQLLDLIGDRLSGKHLDAMLLHIENCDRCRVRMDELSAESHHWTKRQPLRYQVAVGRKSLAVDMMTKSTEHYRILAVGCNLGTVGPIC